MLRVSEIVKYIEDKNEVTLTDVQVDILRHIIKGEIIYTPRACGRSMLYEGYADYLKNVVGKGTDYSIDPLDFDKVYRFSDIKKDTGMYYPENFAENMKSKDGSRFAKEFECRYRTKYRMNLRFPVGVSLEDCRADQPSQNKGELNTWTIRRIRCYSDNFESLDTILVIAFAFSSDS